MTVKSRVPARSKAFKATRGHHSAEAAEDYCELIADLVRLHGSARVGQIAKELGVSHVTALRTVKRLQSEGYVSAAPRRPIGLTASGARIAQRAKERHELLVDFFVQLGVPPSVAEIDVEGAEHHISPQTLAAIRRSMGR